MKSVSDGGQSGYQLKVVRPGSVLGVESARIGSVRGGKCRSKKKCLSVVVVVLSDDDDGDVGRHFPSSTIFSEVRWLSKKVKKKLRLLVTDRDPR